MKIEKKDLGKSQVEVSVELPFDDFKSYFQKGADNLSKEAKIDGFRPGKVPYDVLKSKVGEMAILEEAARLAINATIDKAIAEAGGEPVGHPEVKVSKLAPDNPLEYKVVIAMIPEVKLGAYKDLKMKYDKIETSDEEVEKMIKDISEMRVREQISDKEAKEGDKVIADVRMFLDNVPLEGGQGKDVTVIIGKEFYVPGFDKEITGMKKGDTKEFKLHYSEDHYQKNLAGKMVEFKVTIKEVFERIMPELNDDFAVGFGAKNMTELRDSIKKSINEQKELEVRQKKEIEMLAKIVDDAKFGDIPNLLVNHEIDNMLHELEHSIQGQGGKFDDYLKHINKTRDQLMLDMTPDAIKRVKTSLLIREISKIEKIEATEDEVKKQLDEIRAHYKGNQEALGRVEEPGYKSYVANVLMNRKVIDKLREWNIS